MVSFVLWWVLLSCTFNAYVAESSPDRDERPEWTEKTDRAWTGHQKKLSETIEEIMVSEYFRSISKRYLQGTTRNGSSSSGHMYGVPRTPDLREYLKDYRGGVEEPCTGMKNNNTPRVGCCQHEGMRYLFNAKMRGKSFVIFGGEQPKIKLPPMESMVLQQRHYFSMSVEHKPGVLITQSNECKTFFRGTLHFKGMATVNNVYHSIADNFMVILATILTDAILFPEYLHLPRMMATGHEPQHQETSHFKMTEKLFSAGVHNVKEVKTFRHIRVARY
jgi:hypothetical protein